MSQYLYFYCWNRFTCQSQGSVRLLACLYLLLFAQSVVCSSWVQRGSDIDGEAADDYFGYSTAMSGNGTIFAAGAFDNDGGGFSSGQVRVYRWTGSIWVQMGSDINGPSTGAQFGWSVDLSSNGKVLAAGAPGYGSNRGLAHVYSWSGSTWILQGGEFSGQIASDQFGYDVSLSSDGTVLAVGAPYHDGSSGSDCGEVRVFEWIGSGWSQRGSDIDGKVAGDHSGWSVSLSADGLVLAVGAPDNDGGGVSSGHVRAYVWGGSSWSQRGSDINGEASNDGFGVSVSLSSDGSVLAVGAKGNDDGGSGSGHVRVFEWNGSTWVQRGSDIAGISANSEFGSSVELSSDGDVLVAGGLYYDNDRGYVRAYMWTGSTWSQIGDTLNGEASGDQFGISVSISGDASVIAVGAHFNDGSGTSSGHTRAFYYVGDPTSQPSVQPSSHPSGKPTLHPSRQPSSQPTAQPSFQPTAQPSSGPSHAPSSQPSCSPSYQPSSQPTTRPTRVPSASPTFEPSGQPTSTPSRVPTSQPTERPSTQPSSYPTWQPSRQPTCQPTSRPSSQPTVQPSSRPSHVPSSQPTCRPSYQPSRQPTSRPTRFPSARPTVQPSAQPSRQPNAAPSGVPTSQPSTQPSSQPSTAPTWQPTCRPSNQPTSQPSARPTSLPSTWPTIQPSAQPSRQPSAMPSGVPTCQPSTQPSGQPSSKPTMQPTAHPTTQPSAHPSTQPSSQPTSCPSGHPTTQPSSSPSSSPTSQPSCPPSGQPTSTPSSPPSVAPSSQPTGQPTAQPSSFPTSKPSDQPSSAPSSQPSRRPSVRPSSQPTAIPSMQPTCQPSSIPTSRPTSQPSMLPSFQPTAQPTSHPSVQPSSRPSTLPTTQPQSSPSSQPSQQPSAEPSGQPTSRPTRVPTSDPTSSPSVYPSARPSANPSMQPSSQPSAHPSCEPTSQPTVFPSVQPTTIPTSCPSSCPSVVPSSNPSCVPTSQPTVYPSVQPSSIPTGYPTACPSVAPSSDPSLQPTSRPTSNPTSQPSTQPVAYPSSQPSVQPSCIPSHQPSNQPTCRPSTQPSSQPYGHPTRQPVCSTRQPSTMQPSTSQGVSEPTALPTVQLVPVTQKSVTVALPPAPVSSNSSTPTASPSVLVLPTISIPAASNTNGASSLSIGVPTPTSGNTTGISVQVSVVEYSADSWDPNSNVDRNTSQQAPAGSFVGEVVLESNILVVDVSVSVSGNSSGNGSSTARPMFIANMSHLSSGGSGRNGDELNEATVLFQHNCTAGVRETVMFGCPDNVTVYNLTCYGTATVSLTRSCPVLRRSCNVVSLVDFHITDTSYCRMVETTQLFTVCACGDWDNDDASSRRSLLTGEQREVVDGAELVTTNRQWLASSSVIAVESVDDDDALTADDDDGNGESPTLSSTAVSVGVMTGYVATDFSATLSVSSSLTSPSVVTSSVATVSFLGTVWMVFLIVWLFGSVNWYVRFGKPEKQKRDNQLHAIVPDTAVGDNARSKQLSCCQTELDYLSLCVPRVFRSQQPSSMWVALVTELIFRHPYLRVGYAMSSGNLAPSEVERSDDNEQSLQGSNASPTLTRVPVRFLWEVLELWTHFSVSLFLVAVLFDLQHPTDDGSCTAHVEEETCEERASFLDSTQSYCVWVVPLSSSAIRAASRVAGSLLYAQREVSTLVTTQVEAIRWSPSVLRPYCGYNDSPLSWQSTLMVLLLTSLISFVFIAPVERLFAVVMAPSNGNTKLSESNKDDRATTSRLFNFQRKPAAPVHSSSTLFAMSYPSGQTIRSRQLLSQRLRDRSLVAFQDPESPVVSPTRPRQTTVSVETPTRPEEQFWVDIDDQLHAMEASEEAATTQRWAFLWYKAWTNLRSVYQRELKFGGSNTTDVVDGSSSQKLAAAMISHFHNPNDSFLAVTSQETVRAMQSLMRDVAVTTESAIVQMERVAGSRELSDAILGMTILHRWMYDVLGGPIRAPTARLFAQVLSQQFSSKYDMMRLTAGGVTSFNRVVQILCEILIVSVNVFAVFFALLRGLRHGPAWQTSFVAVCITKWLAKVCLFQTLDIIGVDVCIPLLISREVRSVRRLLEWMVTRVDSSRFGNDRHDALLDAMSYSSVSRQLASHWPDLWESRVVSSLHGPWPVGLVGVEEVVSNVYTELESDGTRVETGMRESFRKVLVKVCSSVPVVVQRLLVKAVACGVFVALLALWLLMPFIVRWTLAAVVVCGVVVLCVFMQRRVVRRERRQVHELPVAPEVAAQCLSSSGDCIAKQVSLELPVAPAIPAQSFPINGGCIAKQISLDVKLAPDAVDSVTDQIQPFCSDKRGGYDDDAVPNSVSDFTDSDDDEYSSDSGKTADSSLDEQQRKLSATFVKVESMDDVHESLSGGGLDTKSEHKLDSEEHVEVLDHDDEVDMDAISKKWSDWLDEGLSDSSDGDDLGFD